MVFIDQIAISLVRIVRAVLVWLRLARFLDYEMAHINWTHRDNLLVVAGWQLLRRHAQALVLFAISIRLRYAEQVLLLRVDGRGQAELVHFAALEQGQLVEVVDLDELASGLVA